MNALEIMTACVELQDKVAYGKGYYSPAVSTKINWIGYELTLTVEYSTKAGAGCKTEFFHGPAEADFGPLFARANEFVDGLVSVEETKKNDFIAAVGRLIEQGRDVGIDVDFLNPLTDMMKSLSTNIITKQ
jgi:hypothetical protein